jgi:hypothetical protein
MEIADSKYDALLSYIETGASDNLSTEMVEYLSTLELIRSMHMRYENRQAIVKFIQGPPYSLSPYLANKYYSDAINFFYLDIDIKKQAWRNMYAEMLERSAEIIIKTAKTSKDIDIYKNVILAAGFMRQLGEPEPDDIPEEFFQKPIKVYTIDPELVGRKKANRYELARHIDSLDIPEREKLRVKGDALIEDLDLFPEDED